MTAINVDALNHQWTKLTNATMHLSHIPQCTGLEQKWAHFCFKVVYYGVWDMCIMEFVRLVNYSETEQ